MNDDDTFKLNPQSHVRFLEMNVYKCNEIQL